MKIQLNTDRTIPGNAGMEERINGVVEGALLRFGDQITRVEIHLSDENAKKRGPDDSRCVLEVRLAGRDPIAVTHQAADIDKAANGAADKMVRLLDSMLGRLRDPQRVKADLAPPEDPAT